MLIMLFFWQKIEHKYIKEKKNAENITYFVWLLSWVFYSTDVQRHYQRKVCEE